MENRWSASVHGDRGSAASIAYPLLSRNWGREARESGKLKSDAIRKLGPTENPTILFSHLLRAILSRLAARSLLRSFSSLSRMAEIKPNHSLVVLTRAIERLTPLSLAASWDNVGVLAQAPYPAQANGVLCCIDRASHTILRMGSN